MNPTKTEDISCFKYVNPAEFAESSLRGQFTQQQHLLPQEKVISSDSGLDGPLSRIRDYLQPLHLIFA